MKDKNTTISGMFLRNMIFIALTSIGMWCLVWIHGEYADFKAESKSLRESYLVSQKDLLRSRVVDVATYIGHMNNQTEERLKNSIRGRVNECIQIAESIYQRNRTSKSLDEIKQLIKNTLRPIRFNNGRGYFFAVSMDGVEQLYPVRPELEGKNLIDLQDLNGNFVIRDEINLIRQFKAGFITDFWSKPDKDPVIAYSKISFVKYFKALDWYFGTGEYLDDVKSQIQEEVLNYIKDVRFETEGYLFASTYHGEPLLSNGHITKGTKSILDLTDPNGVKIFAEYQKAIENPDGGFVYYLWPKLKSSTPTAKISFVLGIPEWEWIIGAGNYLNSIETTIAKNKTALKKDLTNKILESLLILFALLLLSLFWARRISNKIQSSIISFASFFKKAATDSVTIKTDDLYFSEFVEIGTLANKMLTDQIQAGISLRESDEKLRTIIEHSNELFYIHDIENILTYVSPTSSAVLGYTPEEMMIKWTELATDNPVNLTGIEIKEKSIQTGEKQKLYLLELEKKDGTAVFLEIDESPVKNAEGEVVALSGAARDVTERILAEKHIQELQGEILQARKMESIGTLSGGIAHDFNNILSVIIGNTELAMDDVPEWKPAHTNLDEIKSAGLRAKNIVRQLLAFSRKTEQNLKPTAIVPVIIDAVQFMRSTIPSSIDIHADIVDARETVCADPVQIEQVMMNLCINASHAMEQTGGVLAVNVESVILDNTVTGGDPGLPTGDYVKITVSDTGAGIDPDIVDRIFDPYFTTKDVGKGSGMGLAVVHGIVKNHGGLITVDSEPGKGTVFSILLPKIYEKPNIKSEPAKGLPSGSETILFVDDEEPLMKLGELTLGHLGYQVVATMSPTDALEQFRLSPDKYDLVITDMTMPQMTGVALAEELLGIRPDIPVIICTGHSALMNEEKAKKLDIAAFVMKPFSRQKIAKIIRQVLDGK